MLIGFSAALCVLILLPLSWLVYYAFTDRDGAFTLANFAQLVTDPSFLDPLVTTFILATQLGGDLLRWWRRRWGGWWRAPTCRCAGRCGRW